MRTSMNFSDRFQVQLSIVFCLQIWKPSSATFNNCAWIIFSQNTSNLVGYLFIKAFFLIHVLKEQLGHILFYFVRGSCVRWGHYLLFWMNCVADLFWRSFYLRRSSIGSLVESAFFIRVLLKVYFDIEGKIGQLTVRRTSSFII
jgi:hypothetical protein